MTTTKSPAKRHTDPNQFFDELHGGVFSEKLGYALATAATAAVAHGNDGKRTSKVTVEFTLKQLGDNDQVNITHKLSHSYPTPRGKKVEEDTTQTAMFVGPGGALSLVPPKVDDHGQFSLASEDDGVPSGKVSHIRKS